MAPPLVPDAVKVTDVPEQILFWEGLIETVGVTLVVTIICTFVLVAVVGEAHGAVLVSTTHTESLL